MKNNTHAYLLFVGGALGAQLFIDGRLDLVEPDEVKILGTTSIEQFYKICGKEKEPVNPGDVLTMENYKLDINATFITQLPEELVANLNGKEGVLVLLPAVKGTFVNHRSTSFASEVDVPFGDVLLFKPMPVHINEEPRNTEYARTQSVKQSVVLGNNDQRYYNVRAASVEMTKDDLRYIGSIGERPPAGGSFVTNAGSQTGLGIDLLSMNEPELRTGESHVRLGNGYYLKKGIKQD